MKVGLEEIQALLVVVFKATKVPRFLHLLIEISQWRLCFLTAAEQQHEGFALKLLCGRLRSYGLLGVAPNHSVA